MAKYLNQIVYIIEGSEPATHMVLADRKLSTEELVYAYLYEQELGNLADDEPKEAARDRIEAYQVTQFIEDYGVIGPDHFDLGALLALAPNEPEFYPTWLTS